MMPSPQAYQQPPADLVFITQTGPKKRKDQQQLIRQHVMKDIGKSRRKHKNKEKPNYPQFVLEVPEFFDSVNLVATTEALPMGEHSNKPPSSLNASEPLNDPIPEAALQPWVRTEQKSQGERSQSNFQRDSPGPLNIERVWTGRQDPFIQYPIKVNRRTLELMDHIFDERYGNTPPFRDAWLPVGMLHPATFHQVLSNAALNLASLRSHNRVPEEKESMMHHNKALELVAKQIPDHDKAVSDGVIGAIIGFACYAHVLGKHAQWHLHMKAVRNLIELRGGIETLYSNALLRMVLFWVDIGGAVTEDVQPCFPLPSRIIPAPTEVPEDMPKSLLALQISNSWRWYFPDQSEIMVIMDDIRYYSYLLQKRVIETNGAVYKDGAQAAYGILPLLRRILVLSSDTPDERQQKSDIVRLGCILYFAEIRRLFGIMGIMPSLQTHKLRLLLQKKDEDWGVLEILKAWVLAFAAMESSGEERRWFLDRMRESRDRRGVSTWEEVEERLKDILWYGDIHSTMFREVVSGVEDVVYIEGATIGGSRFGGHRPLL